MKQLVRCAGELGRIAKILLPAIGKTESSRVVIHVVGDEQIEPTVAVVIEKRRRRAPACVVDSGIRRGDESPIAAIDEQSIRTVIREVDVGKAIVVDVRDGDSDTVLMVYQARQGSD